MDRRDFLVLSLTSVSILAFDLGCGSIERQASSDNLEPNANAQLHLQVLQSLFAPELVTPIVMHEIPRLDQTILSQLDLDQPKIIALGSEADAFARKIHGMRFTSLDTANKEDVLTRVLARPERLSTYKSLLNVLFADPKYGIDPNGNTWQRLEYQSFDFVTDDAWQRG